MKLLRHLLTAVAALLLTTSGYAQDSQDVPEARTPGFLNPERLAAEIEISIEWLHQQQDATTGGYGSVEDTIWALQAFASRPGGADQRNDPYVKRALDYLLSVQQPDGAICEPGSGKLRKRMQSGMCVELLPRYASEPRIQEALERCQAFEPGVKQPSFQEAYSQHPDAALLKLGEETILLRQPGGYWKGPQSHVKPTGRLTMRLGNIYGELERRKKERARPRISRQGRKRATQALDRGAAFLLANGKDGRWGTPEATDPGVTAMVAGALLSAPRTEPVQAAIDQALDYLITLQKEDGSIHDGQYRNYVTSAAVMALVRAGREGDAPVIAKARAWLQDLQIDERNGTAPSDPYYGGIGYGGDARPDLSNLQMALEALNAAGVESGDETMQKAIRFLERCQNRSESNDVAIELEGVIVKSGEDGGSAYMPGESKAGYVKLADGTQVARSYGSMTYALLKGYLFAGLPKTDPRVEAAWKWLQANYTLDVNPGFQASADPNASYQGLFYYFYTMARALDLFGAPYIEDSEGVKHAWRDELATRLAGMQRQDGSWINEASARWYEGNPVLATAYSMMALDYVTP